MTSMFDFDDSESLAFEAKLAGKKLVSAKHELLTKTGDFLFMAHSDRELAFRMQMIEEDIEKTAYSKLASVSDSKAKLVRAVYEEWQLRHASCQFCKLAVVGMIDDDPNDAKKYKKIDQKPKSNANDYHKDYEPSKEPICDKCGISGNHYCTGKKSDDKGPKNPNKNPNKDPNNPYTPNPHTPNPYNPDDDKFPYDPNKGPKNPNKNPNKPPYQK